MYPTTDVATILEALRSRDLRERKAARTRTSSRPPIHVVPIVALVAMVVLGACSQSSAAVSSPVTEEEAVEMAERALEAYNDGDYAGWSEDWSPTMKAAIDENAFQSFREQAQAQLGDYVAIKGVTGSEGADPGTFRWTFDVEFERGPYRMWFGFNEGSPLIEGATFEEPAS